MNHDFSCCSLDDVQKCEKIKICPKHRYHKMACSMVYSDTFHMNVDKTCFIAEYKTNEGKYQLDNKVALFPTARP